MTPATLTPDEEFAAFMVEASPRLAHTAWLLTGDEHLAEELVQEALTRTFLAWNKVRTRDPHAYARRVLVGRRTNDRVKRDREPSYALPALPDDATEGGERAVIERDRLVRALATLTPRQRRIVVLRHLVGLSEQEVAHDLGVSLGTIKSTASRGLAQLRQVLESADDAPPQPGTERSGTER
ncbi:RNA polymerase, sigma-24 subunit, ECF subfamily [Xylanimonas cellulosilytica DSM 15894]|uniref:RNA polymerase, sigma-24 subunit, ECF subfamily n=1 Tax=Xylanimonas cellulosilytica (strain DSM 15894 / JCM 12276 / CECT 5975 / KCTC 9989 / LMG 20990 / NBRC 107835 / XIL07) TaxID=446471 RepID=D1BWE5_XYLCX|nr:SigE family RNA polymerase sigma factor [Xylanimonas cellulosilytica]ACZ31490.1 RNA polymerase, sigma-24 subunit, ECF subfamily [Xylanimonas cellulosilytica DSM 15894]